MKHGRDAGQLEMLATSKSTIQMSPRKFLLTEEDFKYEMSKQVAITDINDLAVNQRVSTLGKFSYILPLDLAAIVSVEDLELTNVH